MKTSAEMRAHELSKCALVIKCAYACLQLMHTNLCQNLHEIWILSSQDSKSLPHKISWRSELSLQRYLQNNTGICIIFNFQCILQIFKIMASKFLQIWHFFQTCFFLCFINANLKMFIFYWNFPLGVLKMPLFLYNIPNTISFIPSPISLFPYH